MFKMLTGLNKTVKVLEFETFDFLIHSGSAWGQLVTQPRRNMARDCLGMEVGGVNMI
jgi:hypothetical protein